MTKRRKPKPRMQQTRSSMTFQQVIDADDIVMFAEMVRKDASLLDASEKNENLLVLAGEKPNILRELTDPATGLYQKFNDSTTDLHLAAARGDVERIKEIFATQPARMFELTTRGESVLNWANYFMHYNVVYYLLTNNVFFYQFTALKTDDTYYDLARGYSVLAEYLTIRNSLDDVPAYYRIALSYYNAMRVKPEEAMEDTNSKLSDFNQRYPLIEAAAEYGFSTKDVRGDGNCFFNAVADQLTRIEGQELLSPNVLRERAIDYMALYPDEFKGYCEPDLDEYIRNMVKPGTYADHPIILALSRALHLSLFIVNSNGSQPVIIRQHDAARRVYLGYIVNGHYQSLLFRSEELFAEVNRAIDEAALDLNEEVSVNSDEINDDFLFGPNKEGDSDPDSMDAFLDRFLMGSDDDIVHSGRQEAVADLSELSGTVQAADTVEVIAVPSEPMPTIIDASSCVGLSPCYAPQPVKPDDEKQFDEMMVLIEEGLMSLETAARQASTHLMVDLQDLKEAATEFGANTVQSLSALSDVVADVAGHVQSYLPGVTCSQSMPDPMDMEPCDDETADLFIPLSRASSTGSLGLTGFFALPGGPVSPKFDVDKNDAAASASALRMDRP